MKTKFYAKTKLTSLKKLFVPLSRVSTRLKLLVVKPFSGKVPSQIPQPLLWYFGILQYSWHVGPFNVPG